MSFETITIYRDIPIIDGRVAKPPNNPVDYVSIDSVSDPTMVRLSLVHKPVANLALKNLFV